ncbi:MAG: hypothetical protein O2958_00930 [Gemmatimonadetes bacterium]|nr:hypothetical protein [Gemmatimonadota bacterium]MDA1102638.1 hypothetical protein [Gemmatimonadota bacterium]
MSTLVLAEQHTEILASLRKLKGRATVGDVVSASGLPSDAVRAGLKRLLETHRGHLAVSESAELVYDFDARFIERGTEPFLARAYRRITGLVTHGFKAWIVIMLVVYFIVFVVLLIAALFANQRGGDSKGGWGGGRGRHGGGGFHFDPFIWYWIWGPRWRIGRPYYGQRWERTLEKGDKVPFYKKVFAFVFGPDRPKATRQQLDRGTLRLIRARKGVITTSELVGHTGATFPEAESEMGRLLGAYDGEAAVSPNGELVYAFPGVMTSATESRVPKEPDPSWMRLEHPQELTGNTVGANAIVVGMNAFTLVTSATAPLFIFPRLGLGGAAAFVGLVAVPVVFSLLFFTGPLLRMVGVRRENKRRAARNVRRVLLGLVYNRSLGRGESISVDEAYAFVDARLKNRSVLRTEVESVLHELAAELDADMEPGDDGRLLFRFDAIRGQFEASEAVRKKLKLENRHIGDIVFSTSDSTEESSNRDLALFDEQLAGERIDLDRMLPAIDRIGFEDDYELVEFDRQLKESTSRR